jgi:diketogulonate reductase-like aldo/keto reductase
VLRHRVVTGIARRGAVTPAQVVFRFAQAVGMMPLTGTSDPEHMRQDLASRDVALEGDEVRAIEALEG